MMRRFEIAVACGCLIAAACKDTSTSAEGTSSSSSGSTSGTTGDDTTGRPPAEGSTTGGTTRSDDTTSGTTGGTTAGFVFDVGGGMATGFIPDVGPVIDWDCDDLEEPYVSEMELNAPRGYHDLIFDDEGRIIGYNNGSLVAVTYDDVVEVFLPGLNSTVQGMDKLDNGDILFVNDAGELRRVTPTMQNTVVTSGLSSPYGITVGPDQQAYVCTYNAIVRVDPDSGAQEVWLSAPEHPRAMVFNLDSTGVYYSTLTFGNSPVYYVEVDDDLDPVGPQTVFATYVGQGYHDGLGIDACGNLYVPDYNTGGLYKIDPEGTVSMMYDEYTHPFSHYGHGIEWGSGIGGWNDRAIYLPQPYDGNTVNEIILGVPSGSLVRTWRGQ